MADTKEITLSAVEKDAVGEIANMCMGSAATALSTILGRTVAITTPEVTPSSWQTICDNLDTRYVCVKVPYSEGVDGSNVLLIDEADALSIANTMIGMGATELTELELSAIGEVTNQMIGASTTTLSNILNKMVDISPPEINLIDQDTALGTFEDDEFLNGGFIQIKFKLEIEGLVDSNMIQIFPSSFADVFVNTVEEEASAVDSGADADNESLETETSAVQEQPVAQAGMSEAASAPTAQAGVPVPPQAGAPIPPQPGAVPVQPGAVPPPMMDPNAYAAYMQSMMPGGGMPYPMFMPYPGQMPMESGMQNNVNVQSAQFNSFAPMSSDNASDIENIDLIMDVPLEVTVELGRTNKSISEILEFKPGTIVELNKVAGDPIDILVNGKLVAIGEVVVIDENFGIRIVDIIK